MARSIRTTPEMTSSVSSSAVNVREAILSQTSLDSILMEEALALASIAESDSTNLPKTAIAQELPSTKRTRGRPRKYPVVTATEVQSEKRKRGRPRKYPLPDPNEILVKRKRGRPRKVEAEWQPEAISLERSQYEGPAITNRPRPPEKYTQENRPAGKCTCGGVLYEITMRSKRDWLMYCPDVRHDEWGGNFYGQDGKVIDRKVSSGITS